MYGRPGCRGGSGQSPTKREALNQKVVQHICSYPPSAGVEQDAVDRAPNIVESPWLLRGKKTLKSWYKSDPDLLPSALSKYLVKNINNSGLEICGNICPLPCTEEDKSDLLFG